MQKKFIIFYCLFSLEAEKASTVVAVIGFNRPDYFKECLASLEKNKDIDQYEFYLFLDGGKDARQEEYVKIMDSSSLKHKTIIKREFNYGVEYHNIAVKKFLFDECKFEKVMILDDDVVVSPHYLKLLTSLDEWAHRNFDNIGMIQLWDFCFFSKEEKKEQLNQVSETFTGLFAGLIRKSVWDVIKPMVYEYEKNYLETEPFLLSFKIKFKESNDTIFKWMENKITKYNKEKIDDSQKRLFPEQIFADEIFLKDPCISQDRMMAVAMHTHGFLRIGTTVNRCINIGDEGTYSTHCTPERTAFNKTQLDTFSEDFEIKEFVF